MDNKLLTSNQVEALENLVMPEVIYEQYQLLCELASTAVCGNLQPKKVALYLGKSHPWLLEKAGAGQVPFAFGGKGIHTRADFRFGVLPFFNYETQGMLTTLVGLHEYQSKKR